MCRIRNCDLLQSRDLQSHAILSQPLKLDNRQTLVTNKAATYASKLPMRLSTNTNRLNFAIINLEYNKQKTSTITLHVTNRKA